MTCENREIYIVQKMHLHFLFPSPNHTTKQITYDRKRAVEVRQDKAFLVSQIPKHSYDKQINSEQLMSISKSIHV